MTYTIILCFEGGTYTRQASAPSASHVQQQLNELVAWDAIRPVVIKRDIAFVDAQPKTIGKLQNVWRIAARIDERPALFHVVSTVE
jgi:hypothetical protein